MTNKIYITGHKNPDTDSICSSIAYAHLKKMMGFDAKPFRIGDINRETEFVLNYFNVEPPEFLTTLKTRVADLTLDPATKISPDISIKKAWTIMKKHTLKFLPVIDGDEKLIGVLTLTDIANKYMDPLENGVIRKSHSKLENIIETLNARLIYGNENMFDTSGKVVVLNMSCEKMKESIFKGDIVFVGNNIDLQLKSIEYGANCLVVTEEINVDKTVIDFASEKKCIIITTPYNAFTASRLINQSVPVGYIMASENLVTFNLNDFIDDVKETMLEKRHKFYVVVDNKNKVHGILSRYNLISHRKKQIVLVDHNSKSQTVEGIEEAEIIEIIDHHRVAEVQTSKPIYFRNEPVGSTATIISNMYFENGLIPPRNIAGILCSAILSDTIIFRSPTCTQFDRFTAEKLGDIAGIDIEDFAFEMFKAGSSFEGKTPKEIFYQDFKDFVLGKYRIGIAQINTISNENIENLENTVFEFMKTLNSEGKYYLLIFMFTNIIEEGSRCLFIGEGKHNFIKGFKLFGDTNFAFLKGVVSRKKQVIPVISSLLE